MNQFTLLQSIIIQAIPLLFAITVHEVAHGWVAKLLGDRTAYMLGRLTLNPVKHIDPIGTLLVPGILIMMHAPFLFGWAKPVPVSSRNLKNPRRDMALVAIAGPGANLLMAFLWAFVAKLTLLISADPTSLIPAIFIYMGYVGVTVNLVLMILNSLPIPPLDGSRVLASFVSLRVEAILHRMEVYGFLILVTLLATGVLGRVIYPMYQASFDLITGLFGL